MRNRIIYIVFIVLLFLLIYRLNRNIPVEYRWDTTFSTNDKQPFGAYAFDKLIRNSWAEGYTHSYRNLYDLKGSGELEERNLLIMTDRFYPDKYDLDILQEYIRGGGKALVVTYDLNSEIEKRLNLVIDHPNYYSMQNLMLSEKFDYFTFSSPQWSGFRYKIPRPIAGNNLKPSEPGVEEEDETDEPVVADSIYTVSTDDEGNIKSLRISIGEGELILCCNPAIFTNYGILGDSISGYILNHLAYLQGKPLIRTEYYQSGTQRGSEQSEFRYILSQRPLRWAFYCTLTAILILMVFTARRKQKQIPLLKKPANKLLAFVRSIAGLYLQKNNNADLILKKKIYWGERLKRRYGIDIVNEKQDWDFYHSVSQKTGRPFNDVRRLFAELRAIEPDSLVTDEEMMKLIQDMNNFQ